ATVALGLTKAGLSVAVIEPNLPQPYEPQQPPDLRVSAISLASEQLLNRLGAWTYIQNTRLCPYLRLSVWEEQNMRTDFAAKDLEIEHLGRIIETRLVHDGVICALDIDENARFIHSSMNWFDFSQRSMVH